MAQYVIREHHRGRPLAEILEDHYVTNRCDARADRRACSSAATCCTRSARTSSPTCAPSRLSARARPARAATARSHAASPLDLKTTTSSADARPGDLAGDDVLRAPARSSQSSKPLRRLDQVARLVLGLLAASRRQTNAARSQHGVVELARAGSFAPTAQTNAPSRSHSPCSTGIADVVAVTTTSQRAGVLRRAAASQSCSRAERRRAVPRRGSRRRPARGRAAPRAARARATRPGGRSRSRRGSLRRRGASSRAATAEAAAVRSSPSAAASITATSSPSSANSTTRNGAPLGCPRVRLQAGVAELAVDARHDRELPVRKRQAARGAGCRPRRARAGGTTPRRRCARRPA